MTKIHIKTMTEDALMYIKKNVQHVANMIQDNQDNDWIYNDFPAPCFKEKNFGIVDFQLQENPDSKNKEFDFNNSILLYEHLGVLPRYILCDERFWLWLEFEKFYSCARTMMAINGSSTINDHWMFGQGTRRGLTFGIFSRLYLRVYLTIDEKLEDKYNLAKWVVDNPERFRNLTWRSYSSERHIVRGALKGEKKALEDTNLPENNEIYPVIGKYVSEIGSVRLLDEISEEDIEKMVYNKCLELIKKDNS